MAEMAYTGVLVVATAAVGWVCCYTVYRLIKAQS